MPDLLRKPFGEHGKVHQITPESAGWRYVGFSLYRLRAGDSVAEATGDREVILGMRRDPDFGPLLMFGLGGIHVEVLKDVAFRVHPITDADARDMIRSLRGHALLEGVRGAEPVPEDFLVEMLLRLDKLVHDLPDIEEMDLNPLLVGARRSDCAAVDVRIRLREAT